MDTLIQTLQREAMEDFDNELYKITSYSKASGSYYIDREKFKLFVDTLISDTVRRAYEEGAKVTENTSDGYHTFKELYEFRKVYNAVLFNEWARRGLYNVHKSWKHSDGQDCFGGGWFIVVATLPTGDISNHYEAKDWRMFQCEERPLAKEWDWHTAQDTLVRLQALTTPTETLPKAKDRFTNVLPKPYLPNPQP